MYHYKLIIIPNHEHKFEYKILARQISPQIEDLDIQANSCIKIILSSNHQKWQWGSRNGNFFVRREQKQQLQQLKKDRHRGIKKLLNCAPIFLFFYFDEIEFFCVTQNETPKMAKNGRLY